MANIMEYLDWRGDVPFSIDPFNEVDNLILSEIAYTDLEGIMGSKDEMPLTDVCKKYFSVHTVEEVSSRDTFYRLAPMVMKKAAESVRFHDFVLSEYINIIDADKEEQMSALTFTVPGYMTYVAFRGTDNTIVGWKEDFNLSYMEETPGQKRAVRYLNEQYKRKDEKLYVGGHSKGGNFAVYAGAFCDDEIREKIVTIYTNDGPGFREDILNTVEYQRILPHVMSIIPNESLVGILLMGTFTHTVIKSSAHAIAQHDPLTWQVYGNSFVGSDLSGGSILMDKTVSAWLSELDDSKRQRFIDVLFDMLTATGASTLEEMSGSGIKGLSEGMKLLKGLPKDEQNEFLNMLKKLFKTGGGYLLLGIMEGTENLVNGAIEGAAKIRDKIMESKVKAEVPRIEAGGSEDGNGINGKGSENESSGNTDVESDKEIV